MRSDEMVELLSDIVYDEMEGVRNVKTFDEAGLLTRNKGIVINLTDGSEFQITIIKSK